MLASWNLSEIGKALFPAVMSLPGTAEHRCASAGSTHPEPQNVGLSASIVAQPMQTAACRGQEICRSLSTKDAAKWFLEEMQSRELTGERTWRAIWQFYLWLCEEEEMIPLPDGMKARFAHELGLLCQRRHVRIREDRKVRRLTTYQIPHAAPAYLRAAA
jgi:hypothetical protein